MTDQVALPTLSSMSIEASGDGELGFPRWIQEILHHEVPLKTVITITGRIGWCKISFIHSRSINLTSLTRRVHVAVWYIIEPQSSHMGTPLGPKYIPYNYMDASGK